MRSEGVTSAGPRKNESAERPSARTSSAKVMRAEDSPPRANPIRLSFNAATPCIAASSRRRARGFRLAIHLAARQGEGRRATAGFLARGFYREASAFPVAQWHVEVRSPLTVAGAAAEYPRSLDRRVGETLRAGVFHVQLITCHPGQAANAA